MAHPIVPVLLAGLTVLTVLSVLSVLSVLAAGENQPKPRHPVKSVPETAADLPAPLPPEQSRLRMQVPDGFTVELVAAEPDIVKPIAIAFDERGRAWVAQSTDYPHDLAADGRGHDRISICEDSDGDGRADRFTVFANDLNIPTGLVVVPGGVVVANAPDLLLLTDRDGDGRADDRRVLYTGFGRRDTHAQVSNLRHGPDGWLWGTVGYSGGKILVGGQVHSIGAGVFRCRLDGSAFEFVTATGSNTWGLGFDAIGNAFISKANAAHCLQLAIPDRHFTAVRGWKATGSLSIADHNQPQPITTDVRVVEPGFTATCGMALATSSALPAEWQERMAMVCEPTSHLVHLDRLERDGTRFAAKDAGNLLASSDAWTAPVDVTIGPDGQIWVLDWYNYIIRHNPTPKGYQTGPGGAYRTEFRDQKHGRIWRVRRGARTAFPRLDDEAALVAALGHGDLFWRLTAQRLLVERQAIAALPALTGMVRDRAVDARGESPSALHAVRVLAAFGRLDGELLRAALDHPAPGVRQAALTVAPRDDAGAAAVLAGNLLSDVQPTVRLAAALALAEMPLPASALPTVIAALRAAGNTDDRWLPLALTGVAARLGNAFIAAVDALPAEDQGRLAAVVKVVREHAGRAAP